MSGDRVVSDISEILGAREFVVTEVVETEPPQGLSGGKWYRYTLSNAASPITGMRSGSLKSVRQYAEEFADNLNQRALLGYSAYAARRTKK